MFDSPNKGEARLRPWLPSKEDIAVLGHLAFRGETFVVEKQVWQEGEGWWDETAMNNISTRAALAIEAAGVHGFAYTAKAWPELDMPLANSLVCAALNPFELAHALFLVSRGVSVKDIWHSQSGGVD